MSSESLKLPKTKLRIMLSGGGVRGIFQVGVLTEILQSDKYIVDRVYGCSVGSLIAPFVAANQMSKITDMLMNINSIYDIVERRTLAGVNLPNWSILNAFYTFIGLGLYKRISLVDKVVSCFSKEEWDELKNKCFVVSYDILNDKQVWFSGDELQKGIECSSALCLAVPPIPYKDGLFTDGGIVELYPVTHIEDNPDSTEPFEGEYLFVDCDTRQPYKVETPTNGLSLMSDLTWGAACRLATVELQNVERQMKQNNQIFHTIKPEVNYFTNAFDIDQSKMTKSYEDGRLKGLQFLHNKPFYSI
jgi:predicted acylesterase/phospholipase RssA